MIVAKYQFEKSGKHEGTDGEEKAKVSLLLHGGSEPKVAQSTSLV